MHWSTTIRRLNSAGRLAAVVLMLALWLATLVVGGSPALHELLHHDLQNGKHECLVTFFAKSQVLAGALFSCLLVVNPACAAFWFPVELPLASAAEDRHNPSRAPPTWSGVFMG